MTRDGTPLEPDVIEETTYVAGVGLRSRSAGDGAGSNAVLVGSPPEADGSDARQSTVE